MTMNLESMSGSDATDTASVHDTGPTLDVGALTGGIEISLRGTSLEADGKSGSGEIRAPGYELTTPESFREVENTSRTVVNRYTGKALGEGACEVQKRTENLTVTLTDADAFSPTELGRHTMGSGEVEIRNDMTDVASLHVTTHEIMHGTSYSDVSRHAVLLDARTIGTETVLLSGIHQVVEKTDPAGEVVELSDRNRTLNEGLTQIGDCCFGGDALLAEISMPESLETIGRAAFAACPLLEEVDFGPKLEAIGDQAFYGCAGLVKVSIPESTQFNDTVFEGCAPELEIIRET